MHFYMIVMILWFVSKKFWPQMHQKFSSVAQCLCWVFCPLCWVFCFSTSASIQNQTNESRIIWVHELEYSIEYKVPEFLSNFKYASFQTPANTVPIYHFLSLCSSNNCYRLICFIGFLAITVATNVSNPNFIRFRESAEKFGIDYKVIRNPIRHLHFLTTC